jgi:translation initiation factor 5A
MNTDHQDYDFEKADAGAALIYKVSAGSLHKGEHVMIKGHPCKISEYSTAKPGKHGAAKALITGIDILTDRKYECTYSTGDTVDAPIVKRAEFNLINIDDERYVTLLLESGETKEDIQLPEDEFLKQVCARADQIFQAGEKECIVTVLSTMDQEKIIAAREGRDI